MNKNSHTHNVNPITVSSNGQVLAHIFPSNLDVTDGVRFLNDESEQLQVGLMEHPTGHIVRPHIHPPCERHLEKTAEFIFVQNGHIKLTIYDNDWNEIAIHELKDGDSVLILSGGHEVEILEKTRMFEVKQGPYMIDKCAKIFRDNP